MSKNLAVILARGGSKGIPGKNVLPIGGVPLIGRTVSAALKATCLSEVVVSTDDSEISSLAQAAGAHVISRPAELAGDTTSSEDALLHALEAAEEQFKCRYDILVLMQNTSPFQDGEIVDQVVAELQAGPCKSCITAAASHRYFWQPAETGWQMQYQTRGRRQDRPPWLMEAGSVYAVRAEAFRADRNLFAQPVGVVEIPEWRAFEVDEPDDMKMAEAIHAAFCEDASGSGEQQA